MIDKTHVPPESRPRPQRAAAGSPEAKLLEWKRKPCRGQTAWKVCGDSRAAAGSFFLIICLAHFSRQKVVLLLTYY